MSNAITLLRADLASVETLADKYRAALQILEGRHTPQGANGRAAGRTRNTGFTAAVLEAVSQSPEPMTRDAIRGALQAAGCNDLTDNLSGHLSKALKRLLQAGKLTVSTDTEGRRLYASKPVAPP